MYYNFSKQDTKSKILFGLDVSIHSHSIQLLRCQVRLVQTCCLANARSSLGADFRSADLQSGDVSPVVVLDLVTHNDRRPIFPHKKRPRLPEPLSRTADTQSRHLFCLCRLFSSHILSCCRPLPLSLPLLVEMRGLEPLASSVQGRRSPN